MSINALGSICEKVCDSCSNSCFFGKIFDCTTIKNTTVVIGQVSPDNLDTIRAYINSSNTDLVGTLQSIEQHPYPHVRRSSVLMKTDDDVEKYKDGILIAIVDLARTCLETVDKEKWKQESPYHFRAVEEVAQIDLRDRFRRKQPITKREYDRIRTKAEEIRERAAAASTIWGIVKKEKNLNGLLIHLTAQEMEIFHTNHPGISLLEELNKDDFEILSKDIQGLFLKAAQHSRRKKFTRKRGSKVNPQEKSDSSSSTGIESQIFQPEEEKPSQSQRHFSLSTLLKK